MRRHLGLGVAEQAALPWWEHRLYVEGLVDELTDPDERVQEVAVEDLGVQVRQAGV